MDDEGFITVFDYLVKYWTEKEINSFADKYILGKYNSDKKFNITKYISDERTEFYGDKLNDIQTENFIKLNSHQFFYQYILNIYIEKVDKKLTEKELLNLIMASIKDD